MYTNDLAKAKHFYEALLGLQLIWDIEDSLAFQIEDHQLSIQLDTALEASSPEFSLQPGWEGGTEPRTSWSISYDSDEFSHVIKRLQEASVTSFNPAPQWEGYWSFPVLDPMMQTIEITAMDKAAWVD